MRRSGRPSHVETLISNQWVLRRTGHFLQTSPSATGPTQVPRKESVIGFAATRTSLCPIFSPKSTARSGVKVRPRSDSYRYTGRPPYSITLYELRPLREVVPAGTVIAAVRARCRRPPTAAIGESPAD